MIERRLMMLLHFELWWRSFVLQTVLEIMRPPLVLLLISQDFTTQAIRLTDFLPAVFLLCMTFQKCEDLSFSSGTFI
ncbi:hypothetical protein LOB22_08995, partial [Lactobacillus delbrueckii subsp. lactis]|uniref:hypothetical protein n=1 Tax=Lactobacillus delbrueckii TaxID=1584 RepID=UPI001E435E89